MKKKHILPKTIITILLLFAAFYGWDSYMRTTWDNHIVSNSPAYFILYQKPDYKSYKILDKEEIVQLPEGYKKEIEIINDNGRYILKSHANSLLSRSVDIYNPLKNGWLTEQEEKDRNYIVFKNSDDSVQIKIASNRYIHYDCSPLRKEGNIAVSFILDDGNKLTAYAHVSVYENLAQYILCE